MAVAVAATGAAVEVAPVVGMAVASVAAVGDTVVANDVGLAVAIGLASAVEVAMPGAEPPAAHDTSNNDSPTVIAISQAAFLGNVPLTLDTILASCHVALNQGLFLTGLRRSGPNEPQRAPRTLSLQHFPLRSLMISCEMSCLARSQAPKLMS